MGVSGLSVDSPIPFGTSLKDVSFTVAKGEVLGIAGVAGNGQDELLLALSGELRWRRTGCGSPAQPMGDQGPVARRKAGLVAAPEDRYGHAAAPDMSLVENAFLTAGVRKGLTKAGLYRLGRDAGLCRRGDRGI